MACHTGNCPIIAHEPAAGGEYERDLVESLALEGRKHISIDDPCCAFCAGVQLDPSEPPAHAGVVLRKKRACPISIVAYMAAAKSKRGETVYVVPRGTLPALVVNGDEIDPLADFSTQECEACGS